MSNEIAVVTGSFGYLGAHITKKLIHSNKKVVTLTRHPNRKNVFGKKIKIKRLDFEDVNALAKSMEGAKTLYNTYWIRFPYKGATFDDAVENTRKLIEAAKEAGIERIVHTSVANSSLASDIPYYRAKATTEIIVENSGLDYSIIKPTMIFGIGDILVNNIVWMLRSFPTFIIPGDGNYKVQPVFVDDVAECAVSSSGAKGNKIIDAGGPQVLTYNELIGCLKSALHSKSMVMHSNPSVALYLSKMMGLGLDDIVLTRDEIRILQENLLFTKGHIGEVRFSDWIGKNISKIGHNYASEMERHWR